MLQTHATHPSLIYFRSVGTGAGWPAALGALMDLALIYEMLIEDAGDIRCLIPKPPRCCRAVLDEVCENVSRYETGARVHVAFKIFEAATGGESSVAS